MLNAVRIWILFSTLLVASGWILSAFHQLNRIGYGIAFALAAGVLFLWQQKTGWRPRRSPAQSLQKFKRRFKRPAPLIFLTLAVMSFVSGCLYPPYNSDTIAYRIPRVLHWLGEQRWHWIHTMDMRMNVAGCGYEWMITPVWLFTHTDRLLFLINWIPYLMLPGLIFCVLRCSGVSRRVAWWWSWLLASGWCFVMQSASISNDSFAVVYALAAVALAHKSREAGSVTDLILSLLAVALVTGVKQTAIPLVLLWAIVACPQWRIVLARPFTILVAGAFALLISGVPTAVLNFKYAGDWTGLSAISAEDPQWHIKLDSPFWGIVGNLFCLPLQNLEPPFFPLSSKWNLLMKHFVESSYGAHFRSFESFGELSPGISESSAGIGLAIVLMTALSIWAAARFRPAAPQICGSSRYLAIRLVPWVLLAIFMAKVGEAQNARHLAAYYVFLFPLLLAAGGQEQLTRNGWWQKAALASMVTAIGLLVININRPLFPATTLLTQLTDRHPQSKSIAVLQAVYATPSSLQNLNRDLQEKLPTESPIGFAGIGNTESEPILWQPWGSRRVEWVLPQDTPEQLHERGIHFVVIEGYPDWSCRDLETWMIHYHAHLVADIPFQKGGHQERSSHVYITRLDPSNTE